MKPETDPDLPYPDVDPQCNGCGLCVTVCPRDVIRVEHDRAQLILSQKCDYCGFCEFVCPRQAITLVFEIEASENDHFS